MHGFGKIERIAKGGKIVRTSHTLQAQYGHGDHSLRTFDGEDVLESLNVGCLVILGIGIDDMGQAFARAKAERLLQCLKACPGMNDCRSGDGQQAMMSFEWEDELMRRDTENRDFLDV